jgi:hypothetical protein
MNFSLNRKFSLLLLLLFILSIGVVSASDNATDIVLDDNSNVADVSDVSEDILTSENELDNVSDVSGDVLAQENELINDSIGEDGQSLQVGETNVSDANAVQKSKITTKINANKPFLYYTQAGQLIGYLKDSNNNAVKNKQVSILLNGKTFTRTTDNSGKIILNLNLVPNKYNVKIKFMGDADYSSCYYDTFIKVNKLPISIKTSDYSTYWRSGSFFKAKVYDKLSKKPISGIKVLFKVYYKNSLYLNYYSTTDKKGMAAMNKHLGVGDYEVRTYISSKQDLYSLSNSNNEATLKIKPTVEFGCCSYYAQISNDESVCGFRRDSTYEADLFLEHVKWYGRAAVKQYKVTGTYFCHFVITSDGWCYGTGGNDDPAINRAIENLAGQMIQSKSISFNKIMAVKGYIESLGLGHFAIKSPYGDYAVVWTDYYEFGKLNPGEYLSVPNLPSYFRHGNWHSFGNDPAEIGVKIAATDGYGVNRRDITVFHWKAVTNTGSTEANVAVYAANDNGYLVDRSTAYLKDNIYFDGNFIDKYSLPQSTGKRYLGSFNLGKIDYLKIKTEVIAPVVTAYPNEFKEFRVTVLDKNTGNPISGIWIKLNVYTGDTFKAYSLKTDDNGVAKYSFKFYEKGYHRIRIYCANSQYYISKVSGFKVCNHKTVVSAPIVTAYPNEFKEFKVRVLDKFTKKPISGIWIKLNVYTGDSFKTYSLKTDDNGVAKYSFKFYEKGYHRIRISSANKNYDISKVSGFRVVNHKTAVSAPIVKAYAGRFKEYKVTVLDKTTKNPIKGVAIKLQLYTGDTFKTYTLKTDDNGVAKYSFKFYEKGYHRIRISSANKNYDISKVSGFRVI